MNELRPPPLFFREMATAAADSKELREGINEEGLEHEALRAWKHIGPSTQQH